MRVLYTVPNFNTAGSGRVVLDLASNLDRSRFDPEICCFHDRGEFFDVVVASGIKTHLFPFAEPLNPKSTYLLRVMRIARWFRKNRFDLIHSWHWSSDWSEPLAARLAGIPWIYTKKAMSWGNRHWKIRSKLASHIIIINDDMEREFFPDLQNQSLIPLGLDTDDYAPIRPPLPHLDIRTEADDLLLISVANLVPVKGLEVLIAALHRIGDRRIKLFIVGDADHDYGQKLQEQVRAAGMEGQVAFVGKVLDVRPYLALADLFVIPTKNEGRREGMPMAPVEAMSCGVPVIGSRVAGVSYVLKDFPDQLFEPSDVESLAKVIRRFSVLSKAELEQRGEQARRKVLRDYSMKQFIQSHEALYDKIGHRS